jgi:hypothetical protein
MSVTVRKACFITLFLQQGERISAWYGAEAARLPSILQSTHCPLGGSGVAMSRKSSGFQKILASAIAVSKGFGIFGQITPTERSWKN